MDKGEIGRRGEEEAHLLLTNLGYVILETNWRFKRAEIDIIASKDDILVFVEVKTRSYDWYGGAEAALSEAQEARLLDAANAFMIEKEYEGEIRFDLIAVEYKEGRYLMSHFKDVFWHGEY